MIGFFRKASLASRSIGSSASFARGYSSEPPNEIPAGIDRLLDMLQKRKNLMDDIDAGNQNLVLSMIEENDIRYSANVSISYLQVQRETIKAQLDADHQALLALNQSIGELEPQIFPKKK